MITLINSNVFAEPDTAYNNPAYNYNLYDGPTHLVMIDTDGTLTGAYGNAITSNNSIVQDGNCVPVAAWYNYWNCSRSVNGYSQLEVVNLNTGGTNFGSSLSLTYRATFIPYVLIY